MGETLRCKTAICEDDAQFDICAAGFGVLDNNILFFYVRVFNSLAPSTGHQNLVLPTESMSRRRTVHMRKGFYFSGLFNFQWYGQGRYYCLQTFDQPIIHKVKHPLPHSYGLATMSFKLQLITLVYLLLLQQLLTVTGYLSFP